MVQRGGDDGHDRAEFSTSLAFPGTLLAYQPPHATLFAWILRLPSRPSFSSVLPIAPISLSYISRKRHDLSGSLVRRATAQEDAAMSGQSSHGAQLIPCWTRACSLQCLPLATLFRPRTQIQSDHTDTSPNLCATSCITA